jgi:hypothetical protein
VLNSHKLAVLYASRKKIDKRDTVKLAPVREDTAEWREEVTKALSWFERKEAENLAACLQLYEQRLAALDEQMAEETEWDYERARLQMVPGVRP